MPFYDYICEQGHVTTDMRKIDEREDDTTCTECGGTAIYRPSFSTTFILPYSPLDPEKRDDFPSADLRNHRDAVKEYEKFKRLKNAKKGSSEEIPD